MKEKAAIIVSKKFISILSDSSQARKTNNEKELVLVRKVCNDIPIYVVVSLVEMCKRKGTNADYVKKTIDSVFHDEHIPDNLFLQQLTMRT